MKTPYRPLIAITFFVLLSTLLLPSAAFADQDGDLTGQSVTNRDRERERVNLMVGNSKPAVLKELKELRQNFVEDKCELLNSMVDQKVANFDNGHAKHAQTFNSLKEKLSNLIERLQSKGADTSKLEADLAVLEDKIEKFSADYQVYIVKLKDSKNYVCGKSQGAYVGALKSAREELAVVRQDVLDIKSFYQDTIKSDLLAIREQFRSAKESSGSQAD